MIVFRWKEDKRWNLHLKLRIKWSIWIKFAQINKKLLREITILRKIGNVKTSFRFEFDDVFLDFDLFVTQFWLPVVAVIVHFWFHYSVIWSISSMSLVFFWFLSDANLVHLSEFVPKWSTLEPEINQHYDRLKTFNGDFDCVKGRYWVCHRSFIGGFWLYLRLFVDGFWLCLRWSIGRNWPILSISGQLRPKKTLFWHYSYLTKKSFDGFPLVNFEAIICFRGCFGYISGIFRPYLGYVRPFSEYISTLFWVMSGIVLGLMRVYRGSVEGYKGVFQGITKGILGY